MLWCNGYSTDFGIFHRLKIQIYIILVSFMFWGHEYKEIFHGQRRYWTKFVNNWPNYYKAEIIQGNNKRCSLISLEIWIRIRRSFWLSNYVLPAKGYKSPGPYWAPYWSSFPSISEGAACSCEVASTFWGNAWPGHALHVRGQNFEIFPFSHERLETSSQVCNTPDMMSFSVESSQHRLHATGHCS